MFKDTTLLGTLNLTLSNTYSSNSVDRESTYSQQEEPKLNKEEDKEIGPSLAHILPPSLFSKTQLHFLSLFFIYSRPIY